MMFRVAMLLTACWVTDAVRTESFAQAVEPCHQYVRGAIHSQETTRGSKEGCKCQSKDEKVFCDDNTSAVLGRKFLISANPPCEGMMYCAMKVSTTTTTTTTTTAPTSVDPPVPMWLFGEEYAQGERYNYADLNCALDVQGARQAKESSNPKMCKCSGMNEKVFCDAELEPFAEGLFELHSGRSPCKSALYCAVKSRVAADAAFAEGEVVLYRKSVRQAFEARVVKVHREDYPAYYTISVGGVELEAEESRLEAVPARSEQENSRQVLEDDSEVVEEDEVGVQIAPGLPAVPGPTSGKAFDARYECYANSQGLSNTAYKFTNDAGRLNCGILCDSDPDCKAFDFALDINSGCRLYKQTDKRNGGGLHNFHCIKRS